jgi:MinD-like ATPase involved in chromosome partitioning or flagellar assembly
MAATEKKVLIIDFDTQNPEVGRSFLPAVEMEHSLNGLYRGDIEEHEAIVHINGYLDILPMIREINPVPMDRSTFDMIERFTGMYDYVIIDAPPVGVASDTLSLNQIADAAIMVVGFDMATKMDIRSAVEKLVKSGCQVLGAIVNQEEAMESLTAFDRKPRKNRNTSAAADDSLARDMLSGSGTVHAQNTGAHGTNSYQLMAETFGKREEKGKDRQILDELLEFSLNDEEDGNGSETIDIQE